jgi:stage V sporulation protein G
MEITEIKVFPVQEEKLKAFVSVVFDRCFMVNDIKIIQGRQGMFISMPSRKKKNGEFKDVAHPLNNDTRQMIEAQVLTEYDRVLEERATDGEPQPRRAPRRRSASAKSRRATATEAGAEETTETPGTLETRERRRSARAGSGTEATGSEPPAAAASETGQAEPSGSDASRADASNIDVSKADVSQAGAKDTAATSEGISEETSEEESAEKTLEEIEEMHLRDSFWSVP